MPILAISDNDESDHIVQVLKVADDFLQKPVDLNVCAAKVQALLRRTAKPEIPLDAPPILFEDHNLLIDSGRRKVVLLVTEISLPRKQF